MKDCCYGEKLIAVGTAIAMQVAQEKSVDELAVLGDLFSMVGDQLSLLSTTKQVCCQNSSGNKNPILGAD